jgi:hypothetical protein
MFKMFGKESSASGMRTKYHMQTRKHLTDALNEVLVNSNSRLAMDHLEVNEKCPNHPKEPNIAVEQDDTKVFACNKCVFDKRIKKPLFIAKFARDIKAEYDEMYESLVIHISHIEDLTPTLISQRIQQLISDYFAAIHKQLRDIEKDLLQ